MNLDSLRKYCATLPGATRDIKWGADEVYSVGGKMFAAFGLEKGKAANAGFKCDPERFLELTDQPGIIPAPYLARAHWVLVQDPKALTDAAARELVQPVAGAGLREAHEEGTGVDLRRSAAAPAQR